MPWVPSRGRSGASGRRLQARGRGTGAGLPAGHLNPAAALWDAPPRVLLCPPPPPSGTSRQDAVLFGSGHLVPPHLLQGQLVSSAGEGGAPPGAASPPAGSVGTRGGRRAASQPLSPGAVSARRRMLARPRSHTPGRTFRVPYFHTTEQSGLAGQGIGPGWCSCRKVAVGVLECPFWSHFAHNRGQNSAVLGACLEGLRAPRDLTGSAYFSDQSRQLLLSWVVTPTAGNPGSEQATSTAAFPPVCARG